LGQAALDIKMGKAVDFEAFSESIERQYLGGFDTRVDDARGAMKTLAGLRSELGQSFNRI